MKQQLCSIFASFGKDFKNKYFYHNILLKLISVKRCYILYGSYTKTERQKNYKYIKVWPKMNER